MNWLRLLQPKRPKHPQPAPRSQRLAPEPLEDRLRPTVSTIQMAVVLVFVLFNQTVEPAAMAVPNSTTEAPPAITLSGYVRDACTGIPIPNATLTLTIGDTTYNTTTDALGRYIFTQLSPGLYTLEGSAGGLFGEATLNLTGDYSFDLYVYQ